MSDKRSTSFQAEKNWRVLWTNKFVYNVHYFGDALIFCRILIQFIILPNVESLGEFSFFYWLHIVVLKNLHLIA